ARCQRGDGPPRKVLRLRAGGVLHPGRDLRRWPRHALLLRRAWRSGHGRSEDADAGRDREERSHAADEGSVRGARLLATPALRRMLQARRRVARVQRRADASAEPSRRREGRREEGVGYSVSVTLLVTRM